jgi:hypothetical protein
MCIYSNSWLFVSVSIVLMVMGFDVGERHCAGSCALVMVQDPAASTSVPSNGQSQALPELPIVAPGNGSSPAPVSGSQQTASAPCACLPGNCRLRERLDKVFPLLPIGRPLAFPFEPIDGNATCTDGSCRLR